VKPNSDVRSFLVALVPDRLVNPPANEANPILDALVELGFGLVQLPPATLAAARAAIAIDYALDQLEDYAANGYRTIWFASTATAADAELSAAIRAACERRGFTAMEAIDLGTASPGDAARIDPLLRAFARSAAA